MVGDGPRGHRHDGCSPLPLGMDASPAPTRWTGANTIWPHDPPSGWSYSVMVNSWVLVPKSNTPPPSDVSNHAGNSTAYFRVLVGLQSPDGVSTLHGILRRFSQFIKLSESLKRMFPKKRLPAPPKKSFRQINYNKNHLQQRRLALSEWMVKLLADLDVSRSSPMASFLELEEAAKAANPDIDKRQLQNWLEEGIDRQEAQILQSDIDSGEAEDSIVPADSVSVQDGVVKELLPSNALVEGKPGAWHVRRHSLDSDASEGSFASGSELSFTTVGDVRDHVSEGMHGFDGEILKAVQALLPIDQRGNVRRVLATLQRRVMRAITDTEDLVARINQEIAVKDFLTMKVKDVEMELDKVKRTNLESLQQAVSIEREGYMNLQWELEECRVALAKAMEEARSAQESKTRTEEKLQAAEAENRRLEHGLAEANEKTESLKADRDIIKAKAVAEAKVLVKEVKALRKSQPELKQKLETALRAKTELEEQIQQQRNESERRVKLLLEIEALRERLQQCTVDSLAKEDARDGDNNTAVADAADLLTTSDSRIGLLIAEAQLLAEEGGDDGGESLASKKVSPEGEGRIGSGSQVGETSNVLEGAVKPLRKVLMDIFVDNAHLHKLVNSLTLKALLADSKQEKVQGKEAIPRKSMLYRFL